ncbi:MAG: tetratricopeptide repeat protein [Spirochaetales bacterium]|nr:tetratricopeptide repeat protein [Spirochaetales bacterium]
MPRLSRHKSTFNILPLVLFLLTVVVIIFGVVQGFSTFHRSLSRQDDAKDLSELWAGNHYSEIKYLCETQLSDDPFDGESLFFNGASSFYMAISMVSLEDKIKYLESALISLRRNLLTQNIIYEKETYYLLGKTYLHLGAYYSDLAIEYLLKARSLGYVNEDIDEYLAISYSRLGEYTLSIDYLSNMAKERPTPSIYLKMGQDAFNMGQYDLSRDYLLEAIKISPYDPIRQDALLKLGELYFTIKNWGEAEKVLSQYLEIDYNNADVHFKLGEVYHYLGDEVSARREWHRTERLDPHHREALLRLYN